MHLWKEEALQPAVSLECWCKIHKIHAVMLPSQWSLQPDGICMCEEFVLGGNIWNTAVTCWLKNKHPRMNCPTDWPTPHNKKVPFLLGFSSALVSSGTLACVCVDISTWRSWGLEQVAQIKCHNTAKPKEIPVVEDRWISKFNGLLAGNLELLRHVKGRIFTEEAEWNSPPFKCIRWMKWEYSKHIFHLLSKYQLLEQKENGSSRLLPLLWELWEHLKGCPRL